MATRAAHLLALGLILFACGQKAPTNAAATQITFSVPVAPGSAASITLEGATWGTGSTAVVFAHSYPTSQDAWAGFAPVVASRGFLALTFNFRGYGQSQGTRDPRRADLDLTAALDEARSLGATRFLVVGASMGATAALIVGSRRALAGVVAVSAPVSFRGLDATQAAKTLRSPALFIAAENDPGRAAESARFLASSAPEPKTLQIEPGTAAHGTDLLDDALAGKRVRDLIIRFLRDHRA